MRKYWRTIHGWTQYPRGGRATLKEQQKQKQALQQLFILINCQQIFPTRKEFYYIHVRGGETEPYIPVPTA